MARVELYVYVIPSVFIIVLGKVFKMKGRENVLRYECMHIQMV